VEASAFDVEKETGARAMCNGLTFGAKTDRTIEILGDFDFRRKTLDGALVDHLLENVDSDTSETKMKQVKKHRTLDRFSKIHSTDFAINLSRKSSLAWHEFNKIGLAMCSA
jgi:hypothetical protein